MMSFLETISVYILPCFLGALILFWVMKKEEKRTKAAYSTLVRHKSAVSSREELLQRLTDCGYESFGTHSGFDHFAAVEKAKKHATVFHVIILQGCDSLKAKEKEMDASMKAAYKKFVKGTIASTGLSMCIVLDNNIPQEKVEQIMQRNGFTMGLLIFAAVDLSTAQVLHAELHSEYLGSKTLQRYMRTVKDRLEDLLYAEGEI